MPNIILNIISNSVSIINNNEILSAEAPTDLSTANSRRRELRLVNMMASILSKAVRMTNPDITINIFSIVPITFHNSSNATPGKIASKGSLR